MAKYYWSLYGNIYDLLGIKKFSQILNKNTSPYFHSASLVIWPLTMLKRTHFSELPISRFSTYIRKYKKSPRLHTPFSNARSEKRKLQTQNDRAATNPTQSLSTYTVVHFNSLQTRSSLWNRRYLDVPRTHDGWKPACLPCLLCKLCLAEDHRSIGINKLF